MHAEARQTCMKAHFLNEPNIIIFMIVTCTYILTLPYRCRVGKGLLGHGLRRVADEACHGGNVHATTTSASSPCTVIPQVVLLVQVNERIFAPLIFSHHLPQQEQEKGK